MARINISQILFKRGNTSASMSYTGPVGEVVIDTDLDAFRIQDGLTPGGRLMATTGDFANITANLGNLTSSITTLTGIDANFVSNINALLSNAATQQTTINLLLANAGVQSSNIATLVANAGVQADAITSLQANILAANLAIAATSGTYSNANVSAYLTTQTFYSNANVEFYIGANIGSLWSNAATQATSLNTITANLGAYQTYANANAATQAGSITTLQTQVYANANVASYLPTYTGNIAGNIVKNGYAWTFGTDGALTLPADAGQIGISGYTNGIDLYNNSGGTGYVRMNYADESFVWTDSGGSHIQTTGGTWDFGTDANLTLPESGYLQVGTGIVAGFASSPAPIISGFSSVSAENFRFQGNGINILSTVAGTYSNTNVAAYLTTNSTVTALQANLGATQIWANANIASLQANLGVTQLWANANIASINANIGGFYTWANTNFGTSSYSNTNANALLSSNTISTISTTGNIKTIANVIGTTFMFANGVNILSTITPSSSYSNTNVASYLTTATITTTGNVTAGKFIGDGSGLTGVALKTTGSWTVTTGTGTYSFTVPASGTYQLWVDCSISNGILVWNATATVTNNNVPVVGAQYAWVYNGGGSPIDFTSIPNQFTGTGNTIVRSSVAPSATTNRFDFGLNNTSGGNVTVRYGWIQIG